ncbi:MAG: heavy-metal-associated domain-containing protein [Betaproteobacteria bacterium]|nr:heavy-metal-associated domain-containing protein [Betaproteobacteria bacterium]
MIELHLPDMTCGHCVRTVTEVARRLDPQAQVQTDLVTHTARFEIKAEEQALRHALEEEGYRAAA